MASPATTVSWLDVLRRHERRLSVAWLVGVALLFASFVPTRTRLFWLNGLQAVADRYDQRWEQRLDVGARLVEAKRYEEAVTYLSRLDAEYPARTSRQGRDKEREYLLRLLAQSYEATARKGKAMATWERLVQFDSLNYRNHVYYAQAAERQLSGWAVAIEARDGYVRALDLFPSHLPSLRGVISYYADRGEWREVTATYRTFLDAFLLVHLTLRVGDQIVDVPVLADGRPHALDVALPAALPAGWSGDVMLGSSIYPVAIEQATLVGPLMVGRADVRDSVPLSMTATRSDFMTRSGSGWVPADSSAALRLPVAASSGVARVRLTVRVFKQLDASLWKVVQKSYRNLLDADGLADAVARTAPFASPDDARRAFERWPEWASGQYVRGER